MNAMNANDKASGVSGFFQEFGACWRQLPDKFLFFTLLLAWVALFHFMGNSTLGYMNTPSIFGWLKFVLTTSADDEFGLYVPLVVLGLFWWKRQELLAVPKASWWPALGLVLVALLLHLVGFLVQQTRISVVAFFVGLFGLTGLVWGRGWLRASFFPFLLFFFCVPLAGVVEPITVPLRMLVSIVAVAISHALGVDAIREGSQIFDSQHTFAYDVVAACSGIRSLTSLVALATVYSFVFFRTPWKRAVLLVAAVPLAVASNVLRITTVILTADLFGQAAGAWVEQKLGFLTFAVAVGGLFLLGSRLREPEEPAPAILPEAKTA